MFPKPTGRVKTQELENRPTEAALRVAAKVALLDGQTEYEFIWNDEAGASKYMIKLRRSETDSKLIDWGLFQDADPEAVQLWSHTGSDIADVHARLVTSTDNDQAKESGNGNGQIAPKTPVVAELPAGEDSPIGLIKRTGEHLAKLKATGEHSFVPERKTTGEHPAAPGLTTTGEHPATPGLKSTGEVLEILEIPAQPADDSTQPVVIAASTPEGTSTADQAPASLENAPAVQGEAPSLTPMEIAPTQVPPEASAPPTEPGPQSTQPAAEQTEPVAATSAEPSATQEPAPSAEPFAAAAESPPPSAEPFAAAESPPPSAEPFAAAAEPAPSTAAEPPRRASKLSPSQVETIPPGQAPKAGAPTAPSASPFGALIKHDAKVAQTTDGPKTQEASVSKPIPPTASSEPDSDAQEGNPLSWEEQCRTFDGIDSLPIVEINRLSPTEEPSELSGDLSQTNIEDVLRTIAYDTLSGRLSIDSKQKQADIFFFEGVPIHATGSMGEGMEGMLRVIGLEDGHYRFDRRMTTDQRTVSLPLELVIFQGAQLADDTRFLTELHLTSDSILVRKNQYLSEKGFEALLSNGEPIDLHLQKSVYLAVDGQTVLKEIVRRLGLTRTQWVPVVANMIRCKVIAPMQVKARAKVDVKPKVIEPELLATVTSKLINDTSRMLTHPALVFMLEHETNRADIEHPLSLLLIEVGETQSLGGSSEAVPEWALNRIVFLMSGFKRRTDVFGHYEKSNEFALIMPDVKPSSVLNYTKDWVERILSDSVIKDIANNLKFNFGIASIPDDAINVSLLLSAAELAKKHSISSGLQIVLAQDLEAVKASRNTPLAPR